MQAVGNDYVLIDCTRGNENEYGDLSRLAYNLCRRHISVGADGLIVLSLSETADVKMRMLNPDGSESSMCGNAIRCLGKYAYENGIVKKTEFTVETLSGIKELSLTVKDGKVVYVLAKMGMASTEPYSLPLLTDEKMINSDVYVAGGYYGLTCVSMGNPHAVTFLSDNKDVDRLDIARIGHAIETHPLFPERTNAEFVYVIDRHTLRMRVWERGCGETLACGTGACAAAVAAVLCGHCDGGEDITVILPGGKLFVCVSDDLDVVLRGGCETVFCGEIDI